MMRILSLPALAALIVSACATPHTPKDIEDFVVRRDMCDHFRGEIPDPDQVEQMRETLRQIDRFCTGTDAALAALKERYRDNPEAIRKLNSYEAHIERRR